MTGERPEEGRNVPRHTKSTKTKKNDNKLDQNNQNTNTKKRSRTWPTIGKFKKTNNHDIENA